MEALSNFDIRRFVIALNWRFVFAALPDQKDWRSFGIERVISNSDMIAQMINWSMGLPTHVFRCGINPDLYFFDASQKKPYVVFIKRKQGQMAEFQRLLRSRNPEFLDRIRWQGLQGLSEAEYAAEVRQASIFINLSHAEGIAFALLEAMAPAPWWPGSIVSALKPHSSDTEIGRIVSWPKTWIMSPSLTVSSPCSSTS